MQKCRVCTIIPTYNRKELLANCLKAILSGTVVPENIIVVDNASTDGTKEHIESLFAKEIEQGRIIYIYLKENMGCAGGLAAGLEKGMKMDMDYFWLMDDDTEPTKNALLELTKRADYKTCLASIATDRAKQELSFGLWIKIDNKVKIFHFLSEVPEQCVLETLFVPFVGMLIPANIVSNIGFPRADYFIWGDDVEYVYRIRKNGYRVRYVRESIVFHPVHRKVSVNFLWRKNIVIIDSIDWKQYYAIRNHVYLYSRHREWRELIRSIIYYFLVWRTRGAKPGTLHFYIKGLWHGLVGKLGRNDEIMLQI